jgi:hypothetical protein
MITMCLKALMCRYLMEIYLQKLHICWVDLRYAIVIQNYLTLFYPYYYFVMMLLCLTRDMANTSFS